MKFKELIPEDKLICLRIKNDIAVHINLKITSIACDNFSVISDTLDTYTFDAPIDKEINGSKEKIMYIVQFQSHLHRQL